MKLIVNDDGKMMAEDVGLHYKENYMKINTQALEGRTSAEIYYDNTWVKFDISQFYVVIEITAYTVVLHDY